jgi:hypothetical protein
VPLVLTWPVGDVVIEPAVIEAVVIGFVIVEPHAVDPRPIPLGPGPTVTTPYALLFLISLALYVTPIVFLVVVILKITSVVLN